MIMEEKRREDDQWVHDSFMWQTFVGFVVDIAYVYKKVDEGHLTSSDQQGSGHKKYKPGVWGEKMFGFCYS